MKCAVCKAPATKKVQWADGRAYQPSCDGHVKAVQSMLTKKNGKMTELAGVVDLVDSHVYPGLERKPGGPDNWVERAGGLPDYIERIAKHLHYEKGMTISRAIAVAVNTVKRWALGGTVTEHGTTKRVSAKTQAQAAAAVASWNAKRKAGSLNLSETFCWLIDLAEPADDYEWDLLDLAEADYSDTDTMVAVLLPSEVAEQIAVEGGTPPEDMHITLTFHGETSDEQYQALCDDLKAWASDMPTAKDYSGQIGGIGAFPPKDPEQGTPWFAPVDVPGINTLHEQIKAVADRSAPANEDHGYTPHTTLTFAKDGDEQPDPVPATPIKFSSIHVVRGGTQREEIPLTNRASTDLSVHAILSAMDIQTLAKRANAIEDPVARGEARQRVLELASTIAPRKASGKVTDGRRSYKRQGRWGHGFVPLDKAAKESKAKGSPIAMERLGRIFKGRKPSEATGRAGGRSGLGRKSNPKSIKVSEKSSPTSESAGDIAQLRHSQTAESTNQPEAALPAKQLESSKSTRIPARARQNWDEIPDALKTLRNGKRYVYAEFRGQGYITEWLGGVQRVSETAAGKRKVVRSLTEADIKSMTPAQVSQMIKNPRTPPEVKRQLRRRQRALVTLKAGVR